MTKTSELGYYINPYTNALSADYPMSASVARWYINNARHLVDQSTQTRVNWVAWKPFSTYTGAEADPNQEGLVFSASHGVQGVRHIASFYFPIALTGIDASGTSYMRPTNLVVSVAGYTESSNSFSFYAVIQGAHTPFESDLLTDDVIAYWLGATTSNTSEWIIDGVTTSLYPDALYGKTQRKTIQIEEYDDKIYTIHMQMVRLSIYYVAGSASAFEGHLTGVYVREFQA